MDKTLVTETPDELIYLAESDFIGVKVLLAGIYHPADRMYNNICFHATQAVEKFLKGYIKNNDQEVKKEHDLDYLRELAVTIDNSFMKITNDCDILNSFVPNRKYSTKNNPITKQDMNKIIKSMEAICNFPPIKTMRDSFSKKYEYEIITSVTADIAKPSEPKATTEIGN